MSFNSQNFEKKTIIYLVVALICIFIPTLILTFSFSGSVFLIFIVIILIFMVVISIIFKKYFLQPQKRCPRCNAIISEYNEYCKNCGLLLLSKCPKCGNLMKFEDVTCRSCGYSRKKMIIPENVDLKIMTSEQAKDLEKKDSKGNINFCPSCGTKLKPSQQNLRFCEYCGSKLN